MRAQLAAFELDVRSLFGIEAELEERRAVLAGRVELTDRAELERPELIERLLVLRGRHGHGAGNLRLPSARGGAVAQLRDGAVDVAAHAAQRARRPVEVAQRVEHRALHAAAREGVERHADRRA